MSYINAIIAAFTGNHPITNPTPTTTTPVYNNTSNPIQQITPPQPVQISPPVYTTSYPTTAYSGQSVNIGDPVIYYTNDANPLVAKPTYPVCAPTDSACVARNQQTDAAYWDNVIKSQAANNYNRCISDGNTAAVCSANMAAFHL